MVYNNISLKYLKLHQIFLKTVTLWKHLSLEENVKISLKLERVSMVMPLPSTQWKSRSEKLKRTRISFLVYLTHHSLLNTLFPHSPFLHWETSVCKCSGEDYILPKHWKKIPEFFSCAIAICSKLEQPWKIHHIAKTVNLKSPFVCMCYIFSVTWLQIT